MSESIETEAGSDTPKTGVAGLAPNLRFDVLSGFLVFLIALPLCLGIAQGSGFPPVTGLFTAIAGGFICSLISNSELTIKGPAAGMIAIVSGTMLAFGASGKYVPGDLDAYRATLAVGVVAGVIQILFGLFKAGKLGDFFPTAAVHGLLASIGFIIISKQIYVMMGSQTPAPKEALAAYKEAPGMISHLTGDNPEVALIGCISLALMFLMPFVKKHFKPLALVPSQLIVLLVAVPLGLYFEFQNPHAYMFEGTVFKDNPASVLVNVPANIKELGSAITTPNFSALMEKPGIAAKWILMFALVGTLESLLSAKAVDLLDPWRRKTDLNRDILAVGVANTAVAGVGGLPMISEIIRSSANKDNGARTRWANLYHGAFLLLSLVFLPSLIRMIPVSALAAMLVYTGFRLASPKEFVHMYKIGAEQFIIFVATIIGVLATDLLIGIAIGVGVEVLIHLVNGVHPISLFKPDYTLDQVGDEQMIVHVKRSIVFSNWILFKSKLNKLADFEQVVIDLSETKFIDHTVMSKLEETKKEFAARGSSLIIEGLDNHQPFSQHPQAARKQVVM